VNVRGVANARSLQVNLTELDLSWNNIHGAGAAAFGVGLGNTISLQALDLSWNSFGSSRADEAMLSLSNALSRNDTLTHLQLDNNHITGNGAQILQRGLDINRTLLGLHIAGNANSLTVDARGFLHGEHLHLNSWWLYDHVAQQEGFDGDATGTVTLAPLPSVPNTAYPAMLHEGIDISSQPADANTDLMEHASDAKFARLCPSPGFGGDSEQSEHVLKAIKQIKYGSERFAESERLSSNSETCRIIPSRKHGMFGRNCWVCEGWKEYRFFWNSNQAKSQVGRALSYPWFHCRDLDCFVCRL
jgi:hypothetical protein